MDVNTECVKQPKHLAFEKTVNQAILVREKAQSLLERITGEGSPKCEEADGEKPESSLINTLDTAPGRIQECLNEIKNTLTAIQEALF